MSDRITRSAARKAKEAGHQLTVSDPTISPPPPAPPSRKRKVSSHHDSTPSTTLSDPPSRDTPRRTKRQKIKGSEPAAAISTLVNQPVLGETRDTVDTAMSNNGSSSRYTDESLKSTLSKSNPKRATSRGGKKTTQDNTTTVSTPTTRRQKKRTTRKDSDEGQNKEEGKSSKPAGADKDKSSPPAQSHSDSNEAESPGAMDDEDSDLFSAALFGAGRGGSSSLSNTLRALSGVMSGMSARLRDILSNLRQVDNPTMQLVALEEFSNLLLVSNEDNLSGQFSPDPYVKELVSLMQPNPLTGEENPEMMLLACRCIANLMEALRGSVANVVYGGAVPVLCQKLLDIQYIDVAEQALSTLSKVSVDFPASIVREGGLTACLQFLDFFATGTQRTAVTTAANCCRNIPHDSFPVIRDVMPILLNVLSSHDQKVVEQGCLCVTRVIDSFKHSPDKLEQLVDPALLRAILGLLLPGSTNMIGSYIHTEFLHVLAIVARASPRLSTELLKMNVVDTLYQILTGVAPPSDTVDTATKIDSVIVMQALIHRPREQVFETLNVICELLPKPKTLGESGQKLFMDDDQGTSDGSGTGTANPSKTKQRLELLAGCKTETRRFAMVLLPTLTDAYSSTVNLNVRQKVLTAQLKILSNLDVSVIEEALRSVPYASFLASILSQEDHPSLVVFALQAAQLLFDRLEDIYQYQFQREGVVNEIKKLADRPLSTDRKTSTSSKVEILASGHGEPVEVERSSPSGTNSPSANEELVENAEDEDMDNDDDDDEEVDDDDDDEEGIDHNDDENEDDEIIVTNDHDLDDSDSSDTSDMEMSSRLDRPEIDDAVILQAKHILGKYQTTKGQELKMKAQAIREDLKLLAKDITANYDHKPRKPRTTNLFARLARYFDGDALDSITSSELLDSGIVRALLSVLSDKSGRNLSGNPRGDFVSAFMQHAHAVQGKTSPSLTAFTVLVQKLQDLLSRAEHFEVLTVHSNAAESTRSSSASMLTKQLRLRLTADSDSEIPQAYREMIVSIHAIATFKALDDYLRPRFSISERPSSASRRRAMLHQLANARMAQLSGTAEAGLFTGHGTELSGLAPPSLAPPRQKPSTQERPNRAEGKEKSERKRSSRRNLASPSAPEETETTTPLTKSRSGPLECADEKLIDDGAGSEQTSDPTFNALVGGLTEDASEREPSEPGAVNMEIAASGKVTARHEDGTRISTPVQPGTPVSSQSKPLVSRRTTSQETPSTNTTPSARPSSYAAALASVPQDWHIEFSIDSKVIPNSTTIYRAVHHYRDQPQESPRGIWSGVHTVKFRKAKGPPPSETTPAHTSSKPAGENGLPASLNDHPITSSILGLLRILHGLNSSLEEIQQTLSRAGVDLRAESPASFINTKLTAKMNRQLEEPLIVASNCLPEWSEDLARAFPFLFPFETRHLFLQSTSFGYSRSMMRWQNSQAEADDHRDRHRDDRPVLGRPQRQKVRISRTRILESAMKVMEMYGASPSVLEVEYFEEVGTGLGPTLEFYSTVSKEFSKKKLKMWRENDSSVKEEFAFGKGGLFPAPMSDVEADLEAGKKLLQFFSALGKFVARSMLDSRIIDVSFNPLFFRMGLPTPPGPTIALLRQVDQDLANSLAQLQQYANAKINITEDSTLTPEAKAERLGTFTIRDATLDDLALDFTLPGYPSVELNEHGADTPVTMANVQEYIDRVLDLSLGTGVIRQIRAFQTGFSQVFAYTSLQAFTPDELVMLFGRVEEDWSLETLMDSVKADHGFNMDSKSVKNLLHVMSELTSDQRRDFLQFVTGSPKLPIGGFKSLTPMFTVVCKPSEPPYTSDDYLPSVMTCVNYLKLPDYSNQEVLKKRIGTAIREGQGAFHLS